MVRTLIAAHPLGLFAIVEDDIYADVVYETAIFDRTLAKRSVDDKGRSAMHLATGRCRARLTEALYFLGRYRLLNPDKPVHRSATCLVVFATDQARQPVALHPSILQPTFASSSPSASPSSLQ